MIAGDVNAQGWEVHGPDADIARWAEVAAPVAEAALAQTEDWRAGGTWAPGVDLLDNDDAGRVGSGPPIRGAVIARIEALFGPQIWHPAQLSAIRPGYPRADPSESAAATRYRRMRDGAHLDGLLPIGPARRRHLREPHAFVLGIPLGEVRASPLVVWDGSHKVLQTALAPCLEGGGDPDLTEVYQAARRRCFEICRRIELPVTRGEATLLHRHTLHGTAPWQGAGQVDRVIAYFRPELPGLGDWI